MSESFETLNRAPARAEDRYEAVLESSIVEGIRAVSFDALGLIPVETSISWIKSRSGWMYLMINVEPYYSMGEPCLDLMGLKKKKKKSRSERQRLHAVKHQRRAEHKAARLRAKKLGTKNACVQ